MTRQTFKTTDVLKLEVAQTPTGLVNQVKNPPDTSFPSINAYGWGSDLPGSAFTLQDPPGTAVPAAAWIAWSMTNGVPNAVYTEDWAMTAGHWAAARMKHAALAGVTAYGRMRFEWFDAAGALISSSTQSGYLLAPSIAAGTPATHSLSVQQAPANTVRARLRIDLYGNTSGGNPSSGTNFFREVTAATAATSGALSALGYIPTEPTWTNVIGPTHTINVKRGDLALGILTAEILDASIDPAAATLVRPGKRVRLMALNNATATWTPVFTGKITRGETTYDPKRTDAKRARVSLTAVDSISQLAQVNRKIGVAEFRWMWKPLEGANVPYQLGSTSAPATTFPIGSTPLLDLVGIVRDSVRGYAWVNRHGVLWLYSPAEISTTTVTTLDESKYSDVSVDYDTERCINTVTVKIRRLNAATGQTVDVPYGPFVDQASVDTYGARAAEFTVVGIADTTAAAKAYADLILAANGTPAVRINSASIPIRDAADIVTTKALLDLYDKVTVANTAAGISQSMRISEIEHKIEDGKWQLEVKFLEVASVQKPIRDLPRGDSALEGIPDSGGESWIAPTLLNGWVNYSPGSGGNYQTAGYRKINGVVYLKGLIRAGTATSGTVLFVLPAGYRPLADKHNIVLSSSASEVGSVNVLTNGNVTIRSGANGYFSLDDVAPFPADL